MAKLNIIYKAASGQGVSEIAVVQFADGCRIYTRIGASRREMPRPATHFETDSVLREARHWLAGRNRCEEIGHPWANQYEGGAQDPADAFARYGREPRRPYCKPTVTEGDWEEVVIGDVIRRNPAA